MNRLYIPIALALAFSATAPGENANNASDPSSDAQGVDTSSDADRQATETYRKNALSPVPAAPLPPDRPSDMRPKDVSGSADQQAAQTYRSNAVPPVPAAHYDGTNGVYRYPQRSKRHRTRHHHHAAGDPPVVDHRADHAIVEPTSTRITIPPGK